jgi:hypothetical protein
MIWIVTTSVLYTVIAFAALVVIASEERERGKDAYYDIRNIIPAVLWWLILLHAGAIWIFKKSTKTKHADHKD